MPGVKFIVHVVEEIWWKIKHFPVGGQLSILICRGEGYGF